MPNKQYRARKVKDAHVSLLTHTRLGSKHSTTSQRLRRNKKVLELKLIPVYKYVELPIAVKNDCYKTLIGRRNIT